MQPANLLLLTLVLAIALVFAFPWLATALL